MASLLKRFIQSLLKLVNSVIGMVGIAMIMYSVWMIRFWQRHMGDSPFTHSDHPAPWFIYTFLVLGISLSVITCFGHMAAATANGCCLYFYMLVIFLILMLEGGITADVFLNHDWEEDFPEDPSGFFDQFKNFIQLNFEICKWVGLSIVAVQGISFLLAMILKAFGPDRCYDSDDEFNPATAPLLKNAGHLPRYTLGDPIYGTRK